MKVVLDLTEGEAEFVAERVARGAFANAQDMLRTGLGLLAEKDGISRTCKR